MRIEVTQADIDNRRLNCIQNCPVAIAIRRKCPDLLYVGIEKAHFGRGIEVKLPLEAAIFVDSNDSNEPVSPFSFDLEVPDGR